MELDTTLIKQYNYVLLQGGTLPLDPEGTLDLSIEHRATSALIWPGGEPLSSGNILIVDPCFTAQGFQDAVEQLEELDISFLDIGRVFVTHRHRDHLSNLAYFIGQTTFKKFQGSVNSGLSGIMIISYPGHSPDSRALVFRSSSHQKVCVSGDAILDIRWLKAWKYYWPNGYTSFEIIQTWESVAQILSYADLIIPGHGQPFAVTASLVEELLSTFECARYASECQDVEPILSTRLEQLQVD